MRATRQGPMSSPRSGVSFRPTPLAADMIETLNRTGALKLSTVLSEIMESIPFCELCNYVPGAILRNLTCHSTLPFAAAGNLNTYCAQIKVARRSHAFRTCTSSQVKLPESGCGCWHAVSPTVKPTHWFNVALELWAKTQTEQARVRDKVRVDSRHSQATTTTAHSIGLK